MFFVPFLSHLFRSFVRDKSIITITTHPATSFEKKNITQFAIEELRGLSDSGVYTTLSLHKVQKSERGQGVFHFNHYFTVELHSTHFKDPKGAPSKLSVQEFDIIVMKSDDDGVYSFAIDEFPEMKKTSINAFWREMVEEHVKIRTDSFAAMEREELERDARSVGLNNLNVFLKTLKEMSVQDLKELMTTNQNTNSGLSSLKNELAESELGKRWDFSVAKEQEKYDLHIEQLRSGQQSTEL